MAYAENAVKVERDKNQKWTQANPEAARKNINKAKPGAAARQQARSQAREQVQVQTHSQSM